MVDVIKALPNVRLVDSRGTVAEIRRRELARRHCMEVVLAAAVLVPQVSSYSRYPR